MAAYQYFISQQGKGENTTFGIVAIPSMKNENGLAVNTIMGEIFAKIKQISGYDSTILITGEHGTGKELVALAIHHQSKRSNKQLVTINCAAIPEHLLESELFGHVRGAFTHALSERKGAFEIADGGTIFLDEIGDLKLDLQAKFLRVIQNKEFQKVGSSKTIHVNTRIIAATNKNLEKSIENNEFRSDLYFRLNVVNLHVPPLRDRKNDIPFLIQHFLDEFNKSYNTGKYFSAEAIIAAMAYNWPGNIRMLQHCVEQACVMTSNREINLDVLPEDIQKTYYEIFKSDEVPWWDHIQSAVYTEKQRVIDLCKIALKDENIENFKIRHPNAKLHFAHNCYDYFKTFVNEIASIFPVDQRELLVRKVIVTMQEELLKWCREEKVSKLSDLYNKIEKLLGRSRRQIDNWKKEPSISP